MTILTIMAVVIIAGAFGLFANITKNFRPNKKKIQQEIAKMKADVEGWAGELVPITKEELELFSKSQIKQTKKSRSKTSYKGTFKTIFEEPIVAYSYRSFLGKGNHAILYARTANHEFAYWISDKGTQLVVDNQMIGTIKDNDVLYGAKSNRMLARMNRSEKDMLPIVVKDREVGSLVKGLPAANEALSARAFEFVKEDLNEEEQTLMLSLGILEMVKVTNGQ